MKIRQEKTIKATEVMISTTKCMAGSDVRKLEVVGILRSESAVGWYSKLCRVRWRKWVVSTHREIQAIVIQRFQPFYG